MRAWAPSRFDIRTQRPRYTNVKNAKIALRNCLDAGVSSVSSNCTTGEIERQENKGETQEKKCGRRRERKEWDAGNQRRKEKQGKRRRKKEGKKGRKERKKGKKRKKKGRGLVAGHGRWRPEVAGDGRNPVA